MSDIDFNEYQRLAATTANYDPPPQYRLCNWSMGLCGEVGEFSELIKKHVFHSKELDKDKCLKELGDVMWYLAIVAKELGISLQDIASANIAKLAARYPNGFVDWNSRTDKDK